MLNTVKYLFISGHCIYNCALWNVRCDEEISTHFRPIFIPTFARYFEYIRIISGQHIFRQDARSAKINVPSFHFYGNYLTRCDFFVDLFIERNRQWCSICIKLIGSRACASKIYHANITQTRCAVAREISFSLPPFSLLYAFRCSANFSRENAGAHIKHAVIPLNPVSGINQPARR